jgi:hypothetical protein
MKILFEDYTFNASEKKITFNTRDTITLEKVLIITNVTDNIIIYNFANPQFGGTISNNVLTLNYDTTSMSNSDALQIFIENSFTPASEESLQILEDQTVLLRRMVKLLEPSSRQDSAGRQEVVVSSLISSPLVADYTTYIGSGNATLLTQESSFVLQSRIAYATLRNKLDFN